MRKIILAFFKVNFSWSAEHPPPWETSHGELKVLTALAHTRARNDPPARRRALASAYLARWTGLLSFAAQHALACSLADLDDPYALDDWLPVATDVRVSACQRPLPARHCRRRRRATGDLGRPHHPG